ncbi:MAG: hypothetical protein UV58_C0014G0005 [Candidatus Wolfebacteria bacterium GW2011_GWC1_43_10]|uniref:DUF1648 domain-containing protein n=2 Tax=Candidatus Wolfeibacteriota TaxID=1752735 RepID=A0A0G1C943_9BACT|nr:MAG: hypothetical protein UV58_C0014G0005 [Candidatus Wolfebacteria bacterium GW2011_GWC1_43_10]KKT22802.1 MAG: hypothetical protein UW08_C0003G0038 [Parcubacteria group bacterium GW2011_GWB1_43_8b]OGM89590.1 MAG: hypothetical protein A2108_01180 [Candidatus Wolfebacteria bacterium GWA1_42_9]
MSKHLKNFLEDRYILFPLIAGVVFWIISLVLFFLKISALEKNVIIHFNPGGVIDLAGSSSTVLLIIFYFLVFFLMNQALAYVFYFREKVLSYLVSYAAVWIIFLGMVLMYSLTVIN